MHTYVVDVQVCFGLIRSCDHHEDADVHLRVPVNPNPKWLPEISVYKFIFTNIPGILSQIFLEYGIHVK